MTVHSFKDLGSIFNVKVPEPKSEKPRKCRICGSDMVRVEGTNVFVCNGVIEQKDEDGTVICTSPCGNIVTSRVK